MNIGEAVKAMKEGKKVTRTDGWHGKHHLILVPGEELEGSERLGFDSFEIKLRDFVAIQPENDDGYLTPWLCSQADLLAEDWAIKS